MIGTGRVCGDVGEQGAERDHHLDVEPLGRLDDGARRSVRQRRFGSIPDTRTRSRSALGTSAVKIVLAGQSISRAWPSASRIVGRVTWKS